MQTKTIRIVLILAVLLAVAAGTAQAQIVPGGSGTGQRAVPAPAAAPRGGGGGPAMALTNSSWTDGGMVPAKNAGANGASPALSWGSGPNGTVSFVLIMHDPDVARNKTTEDILHWLMFNIPGDTKGIPEGLPPGTLPDGSIQIKNVSGANGYRGPGAPANGPVHHYTIEIFALDTKLGLSADATRDDVMKAIQGHVLGKAVYVGLYKQSPQ